MCYYLDINDEGAFMTIDELKKAILTDANLAAEFENAVDNGQLVDWAKSKGVEANEADLIAGLQ